jgi:hypothetical protein
MVHQSLKEADEFMGPTYFRHSRHNVQNEGGKVLAATHATLLTSIINMADMGVSSDLRSNLFDQRRVVSSENECLSCIDLNNKLKCALDEVSSLNLIIQLLWNELTSDCVLASSVTNPSTDKQEDHEVSIHTNCIEVNSKHCSDLYSFKKRNSPPVNQPILISNCYAQLNNLQDPVVNVNDAIVSSELGLLHDIHREDRQTELINVEANCGHHIPIILNSKIYS